MKTKLTVDKVMVNLHRRLNPIINENKPNLPNVRHKVSGATITREEFEVLEEELTELIFFKESRLIRDFTLEAVYGKEEKRCLK